MAPFELTTNPIDPGPISLETKFPDFSSNINQDIYKSNILDQDSFKTMSMEQESISSLSADQGSIRSEQEMNKNGLSDSLEIGDSNIKDTLKEIINEIDSYAEKDDVLKESSKMEAMEVTSDGITETKVSDYQAMEVVKANGKVILCFI